MDMEIEMVIAVAPNASWGFTFTSKRFLASDVEAPEASGAPKGHQGTPNMFLMRAQEAPTRFQSPLFLYSKPSRLQTSSVQDLKPPNLP